jgi:hypothetical protein
VKIDKGKDEKQMRMNVEVTQKVMKEYNGRKKIGEEVKKVG